MSMQCMRGSGDSFQGTWNKIPQVILIVHNLFINLEMLKFDFDYDAEKIH